MGGLKPPTRALFVHLFWFTKFHGQNKVFNIPSWIPLLPGPTIEFNLDPPTYQQITNVIRKMKTSGSPCPLDQLSIICFKRCPFLRSYLTELFRAVWLSGTIPDEWKKACTILIHKKDDTNSPSNIRPITLETIPLKVFTSCIRNSASPSWLPIILSRATFKKDLLLMYREHWKIPLKWLILLTKQE